MPHHRTLQSKYKNYAKRNRCSNCGIKGHLPANCPSSTTTPAPSDFSQPEPAETMPLHQMDIHPNEASNLEDDYALTETNESNEDPPSESNDDSGYNEMQQELEEESNYYADADNYPFQPPKQHKPDEGVEHINEDEPPLPPLNPHESLPQYMDRVMTVDNQKRVWVYFWDNYVCSSCGKQERHRERDCPHVCYRCKSTGTLFRYWFCFNKNILHNHLY